MREGIEGSLTIVGKNSTQGGSICDRNKDEMVITNRAGVLRAVTSTQTSVIDHRLNVALAVAVAAGTSRRVDHRQQDMLDDV